MHSVVNIVIVLVEPIQCIAIGLYYTKFLAEWIILD